MTAAAGTERLTLTVPEAGELLGIGRAAAYAAARSGELPVLRIGRKVLVPRARLLAMLGEPNTDADPGHPDGANKEER